MIFDYVKIFFQIVQTLEVFMSVLKYLKKRCLQFDKLFLLILDKMYELEK